MILPAVREIRWFRRRLLAWYRGNGRSFPWRNKSATLYHKVVSEILLQRTKAETVADFFPGFIKLYPSWTVLARASESDLQKLLKPIGLWRQRAASIKRLAKEMDRRNGRFPRERDEIEALPGVGQYIANAVLLFCYKDSQPLLDTNMARVLERFFGPRTLADIRDDPYLQGLSKAVVDGENPIYINWAVLDLAALVCKNSDPRCDMCPLCNKCRFASAEGRQSVR